MANAQSPYNTGNKTRAPKKLLLAGLFTDAAVRKEPEEPQKVLVAGLAEAKQVKEYPDTFFGRAFKVLRGEFSLLLKSSIIFILFTLPFIVLLAWFSGYFENLVLGGTYNFLNGDWIGVGYPGFGDSVDLSVARLLWDVKEPLICMIGAAIIVGAIGFSGALYAAKRSFYQDYYKKSFRTYFIGFAKYWWLCLLTALIAVLIGVAIATSTVHLLYLQTLGTAAAGDYVAVVFSFIIGTPLMLIPMVTLATYVSYEVTLIQAVKNALVLIVNNPVTTVIVAALSVAPLLLCAVGNFFAIIIYVLMVLAGSNMLALAWVALASRGMTKCHLRKLDADKAHLQQVRQEAKRAAKENGAAAPAKKPKQQPKPYQNPKKKKKK